MTLKDISKQRKRMINQIERKYSDAYSRFRQEMDIIKELNKQLPKSIKKIYGKKMETIRKKIRSKEEINKELKEFLAQIGKMIDKSKAGKSRSKKFELSDEASELFLAMVKTHLQKTSFHKFIRNMSLIYLTTELESYLRNILILSFKYKPEILATCQKSISYEELVKYSTIDAAREDIMDKEITALLYQDVEDVRRYFEQKFNIDLSELTEWKKFKELLYRRNIIVHNSSVVNQIYRSKTGYKGKKKVLDVSYRYLNTSITLCDRFSVNLTKQLAQKFSE